MGSFGKNFHLNIAWKTVEVAEENDLNFSWSSGKKWSKLQTSKPQKNLRAVT